MQDRHCDDVAEPSVFITLTVVSKNYLIMEFNLLHLEIVSALKFVVV